MSNEWTERDCQVAATIFRDTPGAGRTGHQARAFYLIAKTIGRSVSAVAGRYRKRGATFRIDGESPYARRKHRRKPEGTLENHNVGPFYIPQRVIDDRACRMALDPSSITAALCGDPLPGYSALDRRR